MRRPLIRALIALALAPAAGAGASAQANNPLASASFMRLFGEYRRGDAGAAVEAFARWPEKRVQSDAHLPPGTEDSASLSALAILHTEAGTANGRFGAFREGTSRRLPGLGFWGLEKIFEPHSFESYRLMEALISRAEEAADGSLGGLALSWYIAAMSFCHRSGRFACTQSLMEKGESHFGDNAEFRLTMGSTKQDTRMTRVRADRIRFFGLQKMAQFPEWTLKQALRRDPTLVEARLRRGHLLHVFFNDPDGRRELERALDDARAQGQTWATYLAALFLGEVREDADELEDAERYYRIAVDATRAHTASVALGAVLVRLGRREEGFDVGRRMFGREAQGAEPVSDPYALYHYAQYWQQGDRLAAMRAQVRQR